jgi:hypothetical protein
VHAGQDGDTSVQVVVDLDRVLAVLGTQDAADVLDQAALEGKREGQEQGVELRESKPSPR